MEEQVKQLDEQEPNSLETTAQRLAFLALLQKLFRRDVEHLAELLIAGEVALDTWQQRMKERIKELHMSSIVAARGGDWAAITDEDWQAVNEEIEKQYQYLAGFATDVYDKDEAGEEFTSAIIARAKLYAGVALAIFYRSIMAQEIERGAKEILWVLGIAEHCADCVELAGTGWMPIQDLGGQVPGDGSTACRANCQCHLEFR